MDLVYPLKSVPSECPELRYSLRSVCENLRHENVFIVGTYLPEWLDAEKITQIKVGDPAKLKSANIIEKLKRIVQSPEVSDDFILMNDDFFILSKITGEPPIYSTGSIYKHLSSLFSRHDTISDYMMIMAKAGSFLRDRGVTDYDFGVHCPMVINKQKMADVLDRCQSPEYIRTIYGNSVGLKPEIIRDFKIFDLFSKVDFSRQFASTSNISFLNGRAGRDIRQRFCRPCKYERSDQ